MQQTASDFLRLEHLSKEVPSGDSQISILKDVNLSVKIGESIAIVGTSGSGKTTLLTLMAGLDVPTKGQIHLKEYHLNQLDEERRAYIRGKYVGFIFQSFQLLPTLTALENVMLPLEIQYISHQQAVRDATEWLKRVGLGERLHHYPAHLSGGEQQRVAIARAFITRPEVIFADEMTGNLDTHTGDLISNILFSLNVEQKTTLVLVTHDTSLASRCGRCLLLSEGILQSC